jgi:hypothetical protein
MATYKEVNGTAVQNYAGTYPGAVDGELWYNSTATTFQFQYAATADVWSTGGNLNNGRMGVGGAGSQTAAIGFAGYPPNSGEAFTELYNGSNWTELSNLNVGRLGLAGAGTSASALAFGGGTPPVTAATEEFSNTALITRTIDTD